MKPFVNYIVEAGLSLGIFTLVYWFVLRSETRFKASRFYLLLALVFSTLVPFLTIRVNFLRPLLNVTNQTYQFPKTNLLESVTVYASGIPGKVGDMLMSFNFSGMIYSFGALAAFFVIAFGIFQLIQLASKNRVFKLKRARLVVSNKEVSPYSFFNYIFINKQLTEQENWKSMVHHELEHVHQGHSFDVLFIDLMMVFQWFNPFYWIIRRMVRENHEFLADTGVLQKGMITGAQYKKLLLSQAIGGRPVITSNFFNVKTVKKRFKMITKNKNRKYGFIKYTTCVVMAIALTLMFACEKNESGLSSTSADNTFIYNGMIVEKAFASEISTAHITVSQIDKLDALMLYPELKGKVDNDKVTLIFDKENKNQMELYSKLQIEVIDNLGKITDGVEVIGYAGKNAFESDKEVFIIVEDMPEYPGGELALRKFIARNVKYPPSAAENGIQGKVYVIFVVGADGIVRNAKIARGVDPILDAEAIRVISIMEQWKPGRQRGENVAVQYTVPINFQLQ